MGSEGVSGATSGVAIAEQWGGHTPKAGGHAPDGRGVYLDGYAGPGRYEDGTSGSPALILDSTVRLADFRKLDCYFVERNRNGYRSLSALVADADEQGPAAHALNGRVEKHLDTILAAAHGSSLFTFLDPFGMGVSFDSPTQQVFGSRTKLGTTGAHATEVLLNVNANAVRRIGGLLQAQRSIPARQPR
ncbi:three-Cys-motif partner protein TcmP [Streptomyces sp. NPDC058682]|uniref:three-Cys-motif partner protein TcmP n=1 Tax=Streptomyces sp. NPDC058682 TaxID=3346596 RepID=UPI00365D8459